MNAREYGESEYIAHFRSNGCPVCHSFGIKYFDRTKDTLKYRVYVCSKCKRVVKREIKEC